MTPPGFEVERSIATLGPRSSFRINGAAAIRRAVAREPGLVRLGLAGIALSVVCAVGVAMNGKVNPPEGKLLGAATFDFGVGVYALTIALILPLAGYSDRARQKWRRASYMFIVYGLLLETIQAYHGIDPRFTEVGEPIDEILGFVFAGTAGLTTVLFALLGLRFFHADVLADRPQLRLGIRYGAAAVAISFAVGIMMSVNGGRQIGDGNLMLPHGLGVHGLQALPIVALLISAGSLSRPMTRLHVAGVAWLTACLAALIQAAMSSPPMERSAVSIVIVGALLVWVATATTALVSAGQTTSWQAA